MAKIDLEKLRMILHRNESDIQKIQEILKDVELELQIEKEEREQRPPIVKKQFVTLIADSEGHLIDHDFASWVIQIPESLFSERPSPSNLVQFPSESGIKPVKKRT